MKLKASTKSLKQTAVNTTFVVSKLSEELLPLLFGMQVLWNVSPVIYLASQPKGEAVFNALKVAGYVEGTYEGWKFSKSVYSAASKQLLKCPAFALYAPLTHQKEPPVSLRHLVLKYREKVLGLPKHLITPALFVIAPRMRLICKKVDSRIVEKLIQQFFFVAANTTHDYSISAFETYALAHKNEVSVASKPGKKSGRIYDW